MKHGDERKESYPKEKEIVAQLSLFEG